MAYSRKRNRKVEQVRKKSTRGGGFLGLGLGHNLKKYLFREPAKKLGYKIDKSPGDIRREKAKMDKYIESIETDKSPGDIRRKKAEMDEYIESIETDLNSDVTIIGNPNNNPIALILPTHFAAYLQKEFMAYNTYTDVIIIDDRTYNFLDPLRCKFHDDPTPVPFIDDKGLATPWNPMRIINKAMEIIKIYKCKSVIAFDCFPNLVASIINEKIKKNKKQYPYFVGSGPSFVSTFMCANKYYMRANNYNSIKLGNPGINYWTKFADIPYEPSSPNNGLVVKVSDAQFYTGTEPVNSKNDILKLIEQNTFYGQLIGFGGNIIKARQNFYFTIFKELSPGFLKENNINKAEDIVLVHVEDFLGLGLLREQQVEIVVLNGEIIIHDSGDLLKAKEAKGVNVFKTKTSLDKSIWEDFIKDNVNKLINLGWNNGALDIEFIYNEQTRELQLIEINSRYSFMGYHRFKSVCDKPNCEDANMLHQANVINRSDIKELDLAGPTGGLYGSYSENVNVRNFNNRAVLSLAQHNKLGKENLYIAYRDEPKTTIMAFAIYVKPVQIPLNLAESRLFNEPRVKIHNIENYTAEGPLVLRNYESKEHPLLQKYNGYDKLGFVFITLENTKDTINKWFRDFYNNIFPENQLEKDDDELVMYVPNKEEAKLVVPVPQLLEESIAISNEEIILRGGKKRRQRKTKKRRQRKTKKRRPTKKKKTNKKRRVGKSSRTR